MIFLSSAELFKINYFKKLFHEYHKSVKNYPACKEITPLDVVQSVTSPTADPGVESSIPDSRACPILSWRLIMKLFLWSFSSLLLNHSRRAVVIYKQKYVHEVLVNRLNKLSQEKRVVRWTDHPSMSIAVDWDVKHENKQTKQNLTTCLVFQGCRFDLWLLQSVRWDFRLWSNLYMTFAVGGTLKTIAHTP